jgi:ubiquinone biosynthesis O-methyltransferase
MRQIGDCDMEKIKFTGEFLVPDEVEKRLKDDHIARYEYATKYAQDSTILDIACGYGYGSEILAKNAKLYTGVDINEELVKNAQEKYGKNKKNIEFIQADATKFQAKIKYDLVLCFETIEHITDYHAVVRMLASSVRKNGRIIISSPNRPVSSPNAENITSKPANPYHTQEFTPEELLNIIKDNGIKIKEFKIYGQRNSLLHFKRKWAITVLDILRINPDNRANSKLEECKYKRPKYFVLDIMVE